jgi:hypothetical protein
MKPFTFLLILLALFLGLWIAGRYACDAGPDQEETAKVITSLVQAEPVLAERDFGPDGEDDEAREEAEGLPVPIVPGTRVTEARIEAPDTSGSRPQAPPPVRVAPRVPTTLRAISGLLSATPERASDNARVQLVRDVTEWLAPEVPTNWKAPAHLITRMIRKTQVQPIVKDYATVYEATLEADFSPQSRALIIAAHQREVVARRLAVLGGSLGFILACLGSLAGYIRADEATKGYYTAWLRAIAGASVGAAGVVLYQLLT